MSANNRPNPASGTPSSGSGLPATPVTLAVRDRTARALGFLYGVLAAAWIALVVWSIVRQAGVFVVLWVILMLVTALLAWFSFSFGGGTITLGPEGAQRSGLSGWQLPSDEIEGVAFARTSAGLAIVRIAYGEAGSKRRALTMAAGLSRRYDAFRPGSRVVSLPLAPSAAPTAEKALPAA